LLNTGVPPAVPFVKTIVAQDSNVTSHFGKDEPQVKASERIGAWIEKLKKTISSSSKSSPGKGVQQETPGKRLIKVEIKGEYTTSEITSLQLALVMEGRAFIKDSVMKYLVSGQSDVLNNWHENVTKKNLDHLYTIAHDAGVPLPFNEPLETREQQIAAKLKDVGGVLQESEMLVDLKFAAVYAALFYLRAALCASNKAIIPVYQALSSNVCNNMTQIKDALHKLGHRSELPLAKNVDAFDMGVAPVSVHVKRHDIVEQSEKEDVPMHVAS